MAVPHCGQNRGLKELVDNAADIGGVATEITDSDTFIVRDTGTGVPLEALSIKRPLTSSKHWRLGERGALGNGLRAVMGALYILDGKLIVHSQGRATEVYVNDEGDTVTTDMGGTTETSAIEVIIPGGVFLCAPIAHGITQATKK